MAKKSMIRRAALSGALLVAISSLGALMWGMPSAEAIDCGGHGGGGSSYAWDPNTPDAVARTAAGDCGSNAVCEEWCYTACGEGNPLGVFRCASN